MKGKPALARFLPPPSSFILFMSPYAELLARARECALLGSTSAALQWDQETGMPPAALDWRAEQLGYLSGRAHRLWTAPEVGRWLGECEAGGAASAEGSAESVNVRRWRRDYERAARLPTEFIEESEKTKAHAHEAWIEARRRSEFPVFQPYLEKVLALARRQADYLGYEASPYDALLEEYEPGARAADLAPVFDALRPALTALLGPAVERSARVPADLLAGDYPPERQAAFNREVAEAFGFRFDAGRIDVSAHPFCTRLGPSDHRLTTRYDRGNFLVSLYGVLHETGHGTYEQGLDPAAFGTPAGSAASLGIHESQSRMWENLVGRAPEFWARWLPRAAHHFPRLARRTPEEMTAAANRVAPSFIRVEADQLTYDLHVTLRFQLEKRLLEGDLQAADVPAAWNEAFTESLGLKVPDDARGCLQDVHWSLGLLGYFPTYTLGNLNAAQLFARARTERPGIAGELAGGRYDGLLGWLRERVHAPGQRWDGPALMTHATGKPTAADDYLAYLRAKFA